MPRDTSNRNTIQVFNSILLDQARGTVKFLLNDRGIVFFPATQQHRDIKSHGSSYADHHVTRNCPLTGNFCVP